MLQAAISRLLLGSACACQHQPLALWHAVNSWSSAGASTASAARSGSGNGTRAWSSSGGIGGGGDNASTSTSSSSGGALSNSDGSAASSSGGIATSEPLAAQPGEAWSRSRAILASLGAADSALNSQALWRAAGAAAPGAFASRRQFKAVLRDLKARRLVRALPASKAIGFQFQLTDAGRARLGARDAPSRFEALARERAAQMLGVGGGGGNL